MIEKTVNGYLYNHTTNKYLEIYVFNNLSHVIHDIETIAETNDYKLFKKINDAVNLSRLTIYYQDREQIKTIYSELNNRLKIKNIRNYETIQTIKTILKTAFPRG